MVVLILTSIVPFPLSTCKMGELTLSFVMNILGRPPHSVIVTIRDKKDHIRVLLNSYYTTITGWGGPPNEYGECDELDAPRAVCRSEDDIVGAEKLLRSSTRVVE